MKNVKLVSEVYICPDCGYRFTVQRKVGERRSINHLKKLYCLNCNEEKNFLREEMFNVKP